MATYLRQLSGRATGSSGDAAVRIRDLAKLRMELQVCAELLRPEGELQGMSPEAAIMVELALEVVGDARDQLSRDARTRLAQDDAFAVRSTGLSIALKPVRAFRKRAMSGKAKPAQAHLPRAGCRPMRQ